LREPDLLQNLRGILESTRLPPELLEIEITEGADVVAVAAI